jgi:predicted metal-dependent hydrolase
MTNSRTIQIDGIGAVIMEHSSRARRIIITVRPEKGVRVAVPRHTSFKSALEFVRGKKQWIKKHLAKQHEFTYNMVSIRNQRTRWGSCSCKGNISLNIKLVALPPELFDYVILHELVHTRIHNHSKKFWKELDKYIENGKAKAAGLIEYGLGIL